MELRTRERLYRELLEEHRSSEDRIVAQQLEIEALRRGSKITPDHAASIYGLKRIVLGRSTGGFDHDGLPGDELLQVVVEPRDYDDHAIKAPGTLQIYTLEITPQGIKIPLCMWEISAEQLRHSWKQGLLSTGYTLTLPWKQFPTHEQVRIVVRFVTPDQRVFEADKDIKVRLVPGAAQKRVEMPPEMMPIPYPVPIPEMGPNLLPTGRVTTSSPQAPNATQWHPLEPNRTLTVGRPQPLD
jgi:hypothetical protein